MFRNFDARIDVGIEEIRHMHPNTSSDEELRKIVHTEWLRHTFEEATHTQSTLNTIQTTGATNDRSISEAKHLAKQRISMCNALYLHPIVKDIEKKIVDLEYERSRLPENSLHRESISQMIDNSQNLYKTLTVAQNNGEALLIQDSNGTPSEAGRDLHAQISRCVERITRQLETIEAPPPSFESLHSTSCQSITDYDAQLNHILAAQAAHSAKKSGNGDDLSILAGLQGALIMRHNSYPEAAPFRCTSGHFDSFCLKDRSISVHNNAQKGFTFNGYESLSDDKDFKPTTFESSMRLIYQALDALTDIIYRLQAIILVRASHATGIPLHRAHGLTDCALTQTNSPPEQHSHLSNT